MCEELKIRIHGDGSRPTLVYLPGMHGDWTLASSFRAAIRDQVRLVEFTYPRTVTWSLEEYATAIEESLLSHGICSGWLLGESFGSQIIWPFFAGNRSARFTVEGVILAGGFGRHPMIWGARFARWFSRYKPKWIGQLLLMVYKKYARVRHAKAPETLANIEEFVARRTRLDGLAIQHRLGLVIKNDPRDLMGKVDCPIFHLSGLIDPIVPWPLVQPWFRCHCPTCQETRVIFGDHNVLGTAPVEAAKLVSQWIKDH